MSIALPGLPSLGDAVSAPTQPQYMSPDAIKAQRDYAKALMTGTVGKDGAQFPVVQSWTQGASNMLNALMGGLASRNADERDSSKIANATTPGGNGPTMPQPPALGLKTSFNGGPSSEGREKTSDDDTSPEAKAIAGVESKGSGDYSALGPATKTGDRAYGKYQVMGTNVGPWTQEVLGKAMTPAEFLANPQAQDAVFKTKFAQGGDNDTDRASMWFTGKPYAQGKDRSDGYINGAEYVRRFNNGMPQNGPQGSQTAMALAGPDAQPPAVQAITSALRGEAGPQVAQNDQVAATKGAPGGFAPGQKPLPDPQRTGIYYDPRLIKVPPLYSQEQIRNIMSLPDSIMSPADKSAAFQQFRQQGQPMALPYPGGSVVVDPRNPTVQQFIPEGHWGQGTNKMGDLEQTAPVFQVPTANGSLQTAPLVPPAGAVGPRSEAAPPIAPTAAPAGPASAPSAASPVQGPVVTQNAPVAPAGPAPAPPAVQAAEAAAQKPVQVASLDPTAGITPASPAVAAEAAAEPNNPLAKWAQATPPGAPVSAAGSPGQNEKALDINSFPPGMVHDYQAMQDYKKNLAVDEDAQKKGTELGLKKYDNLSTQAQQGRLLHTNVDYALGLMNDPNFHTGMLSGAQDVWSRFKAAALGDKYANAPNETFDKLMASNVLGTMKTALGGLGQVRLAEIQLLNKANGNRTNTDASNRAVLEISRRGLEKVDQIDGMGQQYMTGDEVVDPVSGKTLLPPNVNHNGEVQPRRGLDAGFDKIVRKFTNDNPSFTPDEIKNYNTIFDTERPPDASAPAKTQEKAATTPAAPATGSPPQQAIDMLKADPSKKAQFEQIFGPGSADKVLGGK